MPNNVNGAAELRRWLDDYARRFPEKTGAALYQEALVIQKASMQRTPVATGALRASHETQKPVIAGRDISVTISVGGPSVPYALFVHEMVELHHDTGEAKFLEKSANEAKPTFLQNVARRLKG